MAITVEEAKGLKPGDILYHAVNRNADGTAQRWRVNGKVRTWKTRPNEVQVPVKHGMWICAHVDETNLHMMCLTDPTLDPLDDAMARKLAKGGQNG